MSEDKEVIRKTTWGYVVLGALSLLMGFIMIFQGIEAYRTGMFIPPTTKSGPMTGLQSIITGFIALLAGTCFLGYQVLKKIKRKWR